MTSSRTIRIAGVAMVALVAAAFLQGCGEKQFEYDTNLLENSSFEDVGSDGIPKGWEMLPFRGAVGESEALYGVDETVTHDGERSFYFRADPGTRRFYHLAQEVAIGDATHVRLQGWIQVDGAEVKPAQYSQCNFLISFLDEAGNRFQETRVADKRTPLRFGTEPWAEEDRTFRVPRGTRFVRVSCILGMNGQVWFDDVRLSVPKPAAWETATTRNFEFHWLPGHPMPQGSQETQQQLWDHFSERLSVTSDAVVNYYFYPDTSTIRSMLSIKGHQYVSWDDFEFHSINPNENHEVIHFITDALGRPPRAIGEGLVFYLLDDWNGETIESWMRALHKQNGIPPLQRVLDYNTFAMMDPNQSMPTAASFIAFIVERWGMASLMQVFSATNGAQSYDTFGTGFQKVCGVPLKDAEAAWRERLRVQFRNS